jgi:non-canonical purine NTP pyrophosphatase (RdgB/HAM1 family)
MNDIEEKQLFFATSNNTKYDEYHDLLDYPGLKWVSRHIPQAMEINITFLADKKIQQAQREIKDSYPFFIEQSGLSIPAWKELPGGFSRIFLETLRCENICRMLRDFHGADRKARIDRVIYYVESPRAKPKVFSAPLYGHISDTERGSNGFGWDPIFIPDGCEETFAEMEPGEKKQLLISHDPIAHFRQFLLARVKGMEKPAHPEAARDTISILFASADPADATRLRIGKEFDEIQEKLKLARLGDRFKLELPKLALRPADLTQALLDARPRVVHFSGHGTSEGALYFENDSGQVQPVQPDTLAALFEQFAGDIDCVVLNACYSETQAKAIAKHIKYVIGMIQAIHDKAAIAFAIGFYQALGGGCKTEKAYKLGCVQIGLQGIPEYLTPVLFIDGQIQP